MCVYIESTVKKKEKKGGGRIEALRYDVTVEDAEDVEVGEQAP